MKKKSGFWLLTGTVAVLGLLSFTPARAYAGEAETIKDGVYIGNIDVGGMTRDEAAAAVDAYVEEMDRAVLTLSVGEKSIEVTGDELGVTFSDMSLIDEAMDVGRSGNLIKRYKDKKDLEHGNKVIELRFAADHDKVTELLTEESDNLDQEAVDNSLTRKDGEFVFVQGEQGIVVNVEESAAVIETFVREEWDGTAAEIELVAEVSEPRGDAEELSKITDLLGGYTTNYKSSNANRVHNIALAADLIDGTILYPGDEFSVADAIGPLDASMGYKLAGAYENGQTVQSYGGGVCQVSTTLYNAVILAELEVTERFNHSMTVDYVKASMDAAIAGDYKDLCFKNNLDTPVYIEGYTVGKDLYFNIYGEETRPENRVVTYESEVISRQDPGVQFVATGDPVGHLAVAQGGRVGYQARLWKVVTVDGVQQSREIFNKSTYKSTPKIVNVGTATGDANVAAAIGAAIATGDEATVYAAVAPYTANASAILNPTPPAPPATPETPVVPEAPADGSQPPAGQ